MTKKDYELIAETIKQSLQVEEQIEREGNDTKVAQLSLKTLARHLALKFAKENPRFDAYKFYVSCGLTTQDFMEDYIPR